jgi:hypothetical protein
VGEFVATGTGVRVAVAVGLVAVGVKVAVAVGRGGAPPFTDRPNGAGATPATFAVTMTPPEIAEVVRSTS